MSPVIETDAPPLPVVRPELVGMSAARLARIRPAMEREMAALATLSPFRQADEGA